MGSLRAHAQPRPPPTIQERRAYVVQQLQREPRMHRAFSVDGAPFTPERGEPVSVVLAIRAPEGIVVGELSIPRERFNFEAFLACLEKHGRAS